MRTVGVVGLASDLLMGAFTVVACPSAASRLAAVEAQGQAGPSTSDGGAMGVTALIVGGGAVAVDFHLPRLSRLCGVDAISIVEPDARRLGQLRDQFKERNDITLAQELPPDVRYSLAVVATPPKYRGEYVDRLKDRCTKLVVETPVARTLAEAEAISEQLERSDATGFVSHVRRTLKSFRFVRRVVAEEMLGDLQSVSVREGTVSAWSPASLDSFSRDLNGGGVLVDTGSHILDLLFQVFHELTLKRAWVDADLHQSRRAVEANSVLELELETGVPVEVMLSRNRHLSNKADFKFARGMLTLDVRDNTMDLVLSPGYGLHGVPAGGYARKMDLDDLFDAYYEQYVLPGTNQGVSPQDSLKVMRIIDDAYRSASLIESGF